MSRITVYVSYLQSLIWLALFMALISAETNIVELLFVDFIHGNPHRSQENALFMMKAYTPLLAFIGVIGTFLIFTLPQFFEAELIGTLERVIGDRARFAAWLALPLTAVLTWYCYDYLTPSNLCFAGNCMEEYEHGLSLSRYVTTLAIQIPVTLFSSLYLNVSISGRSKMPILLTALAITLIAGGIRATFLPAVSSRFCERLRAGT